GRGGGSPHGRGGERVVTPRPYRKAEQPLKHTQQRLARKKTSPTRRTTGRHVLAKTPQPVRGQRQDVHHPVAPALVRPPETLSASKTCGSPTWGARDTSARAAVMPAGHRFAPRLRRQGSVRREASDGGRTRVYQPGLLRVWRKREEIPLCSHAHLSF